MQDMAAPLVEEGNKPVRPEDGRAKTMRPRATPGPCARPALARVASGLPAR